MTAPPAAPADTYCEHPGCGAVATCGVGVFLLRGIPGRWYCVQHLPPKDPSPLDPGAPPPPPPPSKPQGRLL